MDKNDEYYESFFKAIILKECLEEGKLSVRNSGRSSKNFIGVDDIPGDKKKRAAMKMGKVV